MGERMNNDGKPRHSKRQGISLHTATHCIRCECVLPKRRRVLVHDEGVYCVPCHHKRWGR